MFFLKRLSIGLLALSMLAMLAVYLTPLNVYIPDAERTLSARLQMPVRIGSLRAVVMPLPHLEFGDVLLGGQDGIALRSVDVSPVLPELLTGRLALHVKVRDGGAHLSQLRKLVDVLSHASPAKRTPPLRELWLSELILLTPELSFGPLEGKLEFAESGMLQRAWFSLGEQKLTAVLSSLPDRNFAVEVRARDWIPSQFPQLAKLPVDELQLDGVLGRGHLAAQRFTLVSRGLRVEGEGRLDYANGVKLHARLRKTEVPLDRLMALLGRPVGMSGLLSGSGKLDCRADNWGGLAEGTRFVGDLRLARITTRLSESFRQPLSVDTVQAHVVLHPGRVELAGLQVGLYGGSLSGDLGFDRKKSVLDGRFSTRNINMRPVVEALTNEVLFTGRMESRVRLTMSLDRADRFPENLNLAGKFHLRNGTVSKVDLAQVVRNSDKAASMGGVTRFGDLAGSLKVDASGYHFDDLQMSSDVLNADGKIDMTPALQLDGALDVDVKGTAGIVSVPLAISGTLERPEVGISSAGWTGGAVGTAMLGPGLGTVLGVRLGGFMNKLLGNKASVTRSTPKGLGK